MRAQLPLAAPRAPPLYCTVFVGFGARVRLRSIVFVGQYLRSLAGGDGRADGDDRGRLGSRRLAGVRKGKEKNRSAGANKLDLCSQTTVDSPQEVSFFTLSP